MKYRIGLFILFLICGLAWAFTVDTAEQWGVIGTTYIIGLTVLFLLIALLLRGNERLRKYFHVLFAFLL